MTIGITPTGIPVDIQSTLTANLTGNDPWVNYAAWAASDLGGSPTTVAVADQSQGSAPALYDLDVPFFAGFDPSLTSTNIGIGPAGALLLYSQDVTDTTDVFSTVAENGLYYSHTFADRPVIRIAGMFNNPYVMTNAEIKHGNGVTIFKAQYNYASTPDEVFVSMRISEGEIIVHYDVTTSTTIEHRVHGYNAADAINDSELITVTSNPSQYTLNYSLKTFSISGSITPPISEYKTLVMALGDGMVPKRRTTQLLNNTYDITLNSSENVFIMASQDPGSKWTSGKSVLTDDVIHPTNPLTTPFYFRCTTPGATGGTEPVWITTDGGTTPDGTAVWTLVERMKQPVVIGPITPTEIV